MDLIPAILDTLREVLPAQRPIALHEPKFGEAEKALVTDCLDSGWVSSVGQYVDQFEAKLSEYTGIPHAVATVNGTSALHVCLILAGVKPRDEVLAPALTFVGSVNPVAWLGATPHFVDCEAQTLGVDPERLQRHLEEIAEVRGATCYNRLTGRPIRALMVVHVLGHPARMDELAKIARDWHLTLIEDAAEALGSWRNGLHTGSWGQLTALSFNGNKIVTSGGGGAILTADPDLAKRARHLTTTARKANGFFIEHDAVGYNYRLPNLNAALGLAQLERLPDYLKQKRQLAGRYAQAFAGQPNIHFQLEPEGCRSNYWLNLALLPGSQERDALLAAGNADGIQLRPFWTPLYHLSMYKGAPRMDMGVSEALFERGVCLPGSPMLGTDHDLERKV